MGTLDVGQPREGARRLLCPALITRPGSTVDQESTGTGRAGERAKETRSHLQQLPREFLGPGATRVDLPTPGSNFLLAVRWLTNASQGWAVHRAWGTPPVESGSEGFLPRWAVGHLPVGKHHTPLTRWGWREGQPQ